MPHVLSTGRWDAMRWERLNLIDPSNGAWEMHVLDASARARDDVANKILNCGAKAILSSGSVCTRAPAMP